MPLSDEFDDFELRQEALADLIRKVQEAPLDLQNSLAPFVPSADTYQERVIAAGQNTIRLVAPAGSGKTQTIVNRILHRIRKGINPSRIMALTFDNAAATSLKSKMGEHLEMLNVQLDGFNITTLNAYGYGLLRQHFQSEYKNIVFPNLQRTIIRNSKKILQEKSPDRFACLPNNIEDRFYREFFGFLKNSLFDPRAFDPQELANFFLCRKEAILFVSHHQDKELIKKTIQAVIWMFKKYEEGLGSYNCIDFDDQKLRPFKLLEKNPQLLLSLQGQFSEIIVDEFQDINPLDFLLIKTIAEKAVLVVTGDDDQAIYGFRGCSPDYIIDLETYLNRPVASYELQINYRCPANIVEHADKLIRHNKRRIIKSPIAYSQKQSKIKILPSQSASLEAKSIVAFINRIRLKNENLKFNDFAVLYRTNAQSLPLQLEFIFNGIPFYVRKEDNILTNENLAKLLGVLRVYLAKRDNTQAKVHDQILTVQAYFRFINDLQKASLQELFSRGRSFLEIISSQDFFNILPKAQRSFFASSIQELYNLPQLNQIFELLARRFNGLHGMVGSLEEVMEEKVPLGEIYEVASSFKGGVREFVETVSRALLKAQEVNAGDDKETGVALLTYFKAKGLQWHTVILTTCNSGVIPHRKASIEDERRLFYVALTRASSNLVISYLKKICNNKVDPSPFLQEAGLM